MKKSLKFAVIDLAGGFFILLGVIAIANSMYSQNPTQVLFMCYIGLLIMGIGMLSKRTYLVMSQVYILAIPHLIWAIDFFYGLVFRKELWGITNYMFETNFFTLGNLVSLQHLYAIPIAIYVVSLIGIKRFDAWKFSFVQVFLVYALVSLVSDPVSNINCVFDPCINIYFGLNYRLTWFIIIFSMTLLSSFLINKYFLEKA